MATQTPNILLDKPDIDEQNWGSPLQTNMDLLDYLIGEQVGAGLDPNPSDQAKKGVISQLMLDPNGEVWICVQTDLATPPVTAGMWVKLGTLTIAAALLQRNIWTNAQGSEYVTVVPSGGNIQLTMNHSYVEFDASVALTINPPVAGTGDGEYNAATMQDQGQVIVARCTHPGTQTVSLAAGITFLGGSASLPVPAAGQTSIYTFTKQPGGNTWFANASVGY